MAFVSYAQNFEDVLLHRVFGGQETGFYVDVGAYHPVNGSTTKAFYDRGWSGINIEPGSVFAELAAARPRDVNLQIAVTDRAGEVVFFEDETDRGMSHVVFDQSDSRPTRTVPCDTLQAIVRSYSRGRPVDFIKVDAEGAEAAIVGSTDWRVLRPRVLLLEATLPWSNKLVNQEWELRLLEQGFIRAYFDGINCFYVPEEEASVLLRHFQVPVNVLDSVVKYDHEALLEFQRAEAAAFAAERNALRTALDEQLGKAALLEEERTTLGATLDKQSRKMVLLEEDWKSVRAALDEMRQEAARIATERDEVVAALDEQRQVAARFQAERDAIKLAFDERQRTFALIVAERDLARQENDRLTNRGEVLVNPVAADSDVAAGRPAGRSLARRVALAGYRLVRPVVRPLIWRLRSFMTNDLAEQLRRQSEHAASLAAQIQEYSGAASEMRRLAPQLEHSLLRLAEESNRIAQDRNAASEMRRLAVEMERTLLTLAMEGSSDSWPAVEVGGRSALPDTRSVTLLLPHGRTAEIECGPDDLSVTAALQASGGDWEPHVRRYLESVVQPDWVCLDIGANIGAHTLSLAALAYEGRIVAFEADITNFGLLSRNAEALAPKRALVDPVHIALWDQAGTLVCGGADELAGCCFVAEDNADHALIEQRLRTVVTSDAIAGTALHMRLNEVPAMRLDTWVEENPLPRLDLIKLDVEGAEVRVLRGADATLRQHRPILVVEYNPSCAEAYFGDAPDALFRELEARFASIGALELDGTLTPIPDWAVLQGRLLTGKGWEDLVCRFGSPEDTRFDQVSSESRAGKDCAGRTSVVVTDRSPVGSEYSMPTAVHP